MRPQLTKKLASGPMTPPRGRFSHPRLRRPGLPESDDGCGGKAPILDGDAARHRHAATRTAVERFRRLGLQRRIMLYVTVGLAMMFGILAVVGLDAIDQAAQLVYRERLTTAHTTAGILERDLARVAAEVTEARQELFPGAGSRAPAGAARRLLTRLSGNPELSPFFGVSGVWLLDDRGQLLDEAGDPRSAEASARDFATQLAEAHPHAVTLFPGVGTIAGALPFAAVAVPVEGADAASPVVVVHTVSISRTDPYVPADHGQPRSGSQENPTPVSAAEEYHLEVVGPDGLALLGIGPDERPGEQSPHFATIRRFMVTRGAATLLHEPEPGKASEPHVMAAVPLGTSPMYVVLEQPVDVALALPQQLRSRLFLSIGVGFALTLLVAGITTRHVVVPTEQLTRAAERMTAGDLASPIAVSAQDEIGQLSESLEAMRRRLQSALETVERTNRDLESRVADRTARLDRVLRMTISAQEEERYRLARELHDETAQALAALAIALDRARDALTARAVTPEARERLLEARAIAERLLEETRRLILGLRPTVLDDLGLVPAIRWLCETSLAEQGIGTSIEADHVGARLPSHVEVALFRVVQEAVTNVARHAQARHVRIDFRVAGGIARVAVIDDGSGFDVMRALSPTGGAQSVGLVGMQERARLLDGLLEIRSSEGGGTQILAEVPIGAEPS